MSPYATRRIAVTWFELLSILLLTICGLGIWQICENWTRNHLRDSEPSEEDMQEYFKVGRLQREFSSAEEAWKFARLQWNQQRLEVTRQAMVAKTLERTYPALLGADNNIPVPEEMRKRHAEAMLQCALGTRVVSILTASLRNLEFDVDRREKALAEARRSVSDSFEQARQEFEQRSRLETLRRTASTAGVVLFAFWALFALVNRRRLTGLHPGRVVIVSGVLMGLLFGYQAFQPWLITLVSALLLLFLLVTFFWALPLPRSE